MAKTSAEKKKPASERWALPASQARSRATRERLLDAAETVFAAKGYDGAKISDIAQEAGVSVGAVYFRFQDKNALFSAIAESFIDNARAGLSALLDHTPAGRAELLRNFVHVSAASFRRHRGLFRAIVERGIDHPEAMQAIFRFRDELADRLEDALGNAGHKPSTLSVRVMTQMIYGFLIAGVLNARAPTQIDDSRAIAGLADACVAYLACGDDPR